MRKENSKKVKVVGNVLGGLLTLLVSAATFSAQTAVETANAAPSAGCPTAKRPLDFDGDGRTDAAVIRNTGGGSGGQVTWYTRASSSGVLSANQFGSATDFFVSGDFDGDGKADLTVWRPGAQANFYILQSQTNTLRADAFGTTGDEPAVVGDYTGDGRDDPAIYRAGATAGAASLWAYRASSGPLAGQIIITQWGQNGDFPAPGDYDGDGRYDFVVQRGIGGNAVFFLNQTTAGNATIYWGLATDFVVPGFYDNDCKTDITVSRTVSGGVNWYVRNSTNGALQSFAFGASGDSRTQGDYDGDGATDIAVWRPSATPGATTFYWRRSIDGVLGAQQWGQTGDYPVANFNTH